MRQRREELRRQTVARAAALRRAEWNVNARRRQPLSPGDLVLAEQTADFPVEWLVLEASDSDPRRLLVAPADTQALCGTHDVELSRAETGGPVVVRCGRALWITADALSRRHRRGQVDGEGLAAARASHARSRSGPTPEESVEHEIDAHPDYQDWIRDVVEPAVEQLRDNRRRDAAAAMPDADGPARRATGGRAPIPRLRRFDRIAAAVLLAVNLGLAAGWLAEHRRSDRERTSHLPVAFLTDRGPLRGQADTLELPAAAGRFVLVVFLDPERLFDRYRAEIASDDGEPLWTAADVPRGGEAHLGLELRRDVLPDGSYVLRLFGLTAAGTEPTGVFDFEIVSR